MTTTFTDFFHRQLAKEGSDRFLFREMAEPMDIVKAPYKFDQDDVEFLNQFPRAFQTAAWTKRWHDLLFEALREREQRRKPVYERAYQRLYPKELARFQGNQKKAHRKAQFQAEKIAERQVPNLDPKYDQPMHFTFKGVGRKGATTYIADPHLNFLVHKLETTKGDPFHPDSGLEGVGQYGYDLWNARKHPTLDKLATRGFNFIQPEIHGKHLGNWINYTAHQMLGALPGVGERHPTHGTAIKWQADQAVRDTLSVNKDLLKLERRIAQRVIPHLENGQVIRIGDEERTITPELRNKPQEIRKLARLMAKDEIIKMARNGSLRTPPSPDFPSGQVIGEEQAKRILVGKDARAYPPLYLPHHEITARRVGEGGRIIPERHWVPLLLPGKFLRPLGTHPGDADLPDDLKLGHEKDYIEMPNHRQGTDWIRAGAIHPNQNSTGRMYLDPSHENYDSRFQELEALMQPGGLDNQYRWVPEGHGYYRDIVDGVRNGIRKAVGGMGAYEQQVLWSMFLDLHELAHERMLENLRDDRLFDSTTKGQTYRRSLVEALVAKYAQQDWGRGMRRTRGRTKTVSGDAPVGGNAGGFGGILANARAMGREQGPSQRRPGEKALATGSGQFAYDLRTLDAMFRDAEVLAKTMDKEKQEADKFHDTEHTWDVLRDKGELMMKMLNALRNHYESMGLNATEVQAAVSRDWNRLNAGNPRLEVIAQRFKQEFQQLATQQGTRQHQSLAAAPENSMQQLQGLIGGIAKNPRMLDDAQTQKRLNQYASLGPEYSAIVDRAEAQFAKPTKSAARPLTQGVGKVPQIAKQESFRDWIARNRGMI